MALQPLVSLGQARAGSNGRFGPDVAPGPTPYGRPTSAPCQRRRPVVLRCLARIEQALDEDQVEPPTEFASYLGHPGYLLETQAPVQGERCMV